MLVDANPIERLSLLQEPLCKSCRGAREAEALPEELSPDRSYPEIGS